MVKVVASLEGYLYLTCSASIDELCQYLLVVLAQLIIPHPVRPQLPK